MTKKFNIDWNNIDWDEESPSIKSDKSVNVSSALRVRHKNKPVTEQENWLKGMREKTWTKENGEKISKIMKEQRNTPEYREQQSKLQKERLKDPEYLQKLKDAARKRVESGEHEAEIKRRIADPKFRKKHSKGISDAKSFTVSTPFGDFRNKLIMHNHVNKEYGIDGNRRMVSMPHLYYYKHKGPGKETTERVYYSTYGVANSILWHWKKAMDTGCPEALKVKDPSEDCCVWFNKMKKRNPKQFYATRETRREWILLGHQSKFPNRKKDVDKDD